MDSLAAYCFIITGMLTVDICARSVVAKDQRAAGLFALVLMCLFFHPASLSNKPLAIKRFILSLLLLLFLLWATSLMLERGIPEQASIFDFALLLSPLFIMPFYHFLYELLGVRALLVSAMLRDFRLRGALALLLSANIIFISLNPLNSLISLTGHFVFGYLAVLGMFYMCSRARMKVSDFEAPVLENDEALPPVILRYGLSVLEIFYYLSLLYFTFLSGFGPKLAISNLWFFGLSVGALLLITTGINRMNNLKPGYLLSFYENKAVPLSFIFFGLMHLVDTYF